MLVTKTIFAKYINFIKIQDSLDSLRFFGSDTLAFFSMKKGSELKLRLLMKWHHLNFEKIRSLIEMLIKYLSNIKIILLLCPLSCMN